MSLRKVEPVNGECPEGFEFVRGHVEASGKNVRSFCRKKPHWQRHIDRQMKKVNYAMDQMAMKIPEWEEKFNEGEGKQ